jgi:hypothetical protein
VVRALLASDGDAVYHVWAITRDVSSQAATALSASAGKADTGHGKETRHRLFWLKGNLSDAERSRAIFEQLSCEEGGIWGVFAVLPYPGFGKDASTEERQGKVC